jgi:hypothetical protein
MLPAERTDMIVRFEERIVHHGCIEPLVSLGVVSTDVNMPKEIVDEIQFPRPC